MLMIKCLKNENFQFIEQVRLGSYLAAEPKPQP